MDDRHEGTLVREGDMEVLYDASWQVVAQRLVGGDSQPLSDVFSQ